MRQWIERAAGWIQGRGLRRDLLRLSDRIGEQSEQMAALASYVRQLGSARDDGHGYPPGHFYSPIPAPDDIARRIAAGPSPIDARELDLDHDGQAARLEALAAHYGSLPFGEAPAPGRRYHFANDFFAYGDAVFLHCFLARYRPGRIIEVGGGYSTAAMLDSQDALALRSAMTVIEPWPERLWSLLTLPGDDDRIDLVQAPVQALTPRAFATLHAGDLLFIDSSHVLKCGSDLQFLLFEVLPTLPPGVFVHFHDIFYPFEYPRDWLEEGRFWNESYALRALLAGSRSWAIELFNSYVGEHFADFLAERMPLVTRNVGGSLYLRKR